MQMQERAKLEELSGLSADEAKARLVESLKDEAKTDAQAYINEIMDEAKLNANAQAKKIVIQTIQRVATETAVENSVSVFHIDNDDVKGRVIGREGRNIRALEAACGVEIVVAPVGCRRPYPPRTYRGGRCQGEEAAGERDYRDW